MPAHHAHVVVKPFVCRAAWTRQPRAYRGLLVKTGGVRFDAKKRDQISIALDADLPRRFVRTPQPRRKRRIVG